MAALEQARTAMSKQDLEEGRLRSQLEIALKDDQVLLLSRLLAHNQSSFLTPSRSVEPQATRLRLDDAIARCSALDKEQSARLSECRTLQAQLLTAEQQVAALKGRQDEWQRTKEQLQRTSTLLSQRHEETGQMQSRLETQAASIEQLMNQNELLKRGKDLAEVRGHVFCAVCHI